MGFGESNRYKGTSSQISVQNGKEIFMIDENKIKRAIKGDDKAFEELMGQCKENLYRTAFSYVRNEADALDVVQETVYKAYISIDKLKEPKYFNTWITRILINTALTQMKKNSKIVYLEQNEMNKVMGTMESSVDESIYIWNALDSLEEKHREVVILKYFNDLTISEIAKTLEYPVGTAKTYLNKGLNKLRNIMRRDVV